MLFLGDLSRCLVLTYDVNKLEREEQVPSEAMRAGRDKMKARKSPGQTYCRARKGLSMSLDSNSACEEGSFFILKRHNYLRTDLSH